MARQLSFVTLDVFTKNKFAGNPLAVVRIPAGVGDISTETLQKIAREFNLSETAFLYDDEGDEPTAEIPFAGHPTIGAACWAFENLADGVKKATFVCNAGPIEATYDQGIVKAKIPHNVHEHTQYPFKVDDVLKLQPSLKGHVKNNNAVTVFSPVKGMNFILVELPDLEALAKVSLSSRPQPRLDDAWDTGFCGSYFYVFTGEQGDRTLIYRTRMIEGAMEDPATGSAACGLAAYLALKQKHARSSFKFTQAVEMGRQSDIGVTVTLHEDLQSVKTIELSGSAVQVMAGTINL